MKSLTENFLKIEFLGKSANVGLARLLASTFAAQLDFTLAELEEIRVAVSEAVSNCIIHAYPENELGIVRMELAIINQSMSIEISDYGVGIKDIARAKEATFTSKEERMGLGMVFMESFMDEMNITSEPGNGTVVTMTKQPERGKKDERSASRQFR